MEILPEKIKKMLVNVPLDHMYELRLRANSSPVVCVAGRNFVIGEENISRIDIDNIIHKAADYAIYSVLDQIVKGFITIRGGIRIGIAGEVVMEKGIVSTIKNVNAVCIRIPHEIKNCSYPVLPYIFGEDRPYKTLLIAPPGCGKTTFLRDLAVQVNNSYPQMNTLILDERGEIAASYLGDNQLFVGQRTDVITGGSKSFGFENGIRSMSPNCIVTDEIATQQDAEMIQIASRSGVSVLASAHATDLDEIRNKPAFKKLIEEGVFERYVVLTTKDTAGTVVGVYDANMRVL